MVVQIVWVFDGDSHVGLFGRRRITREDCETVVSSLNRALDEVEKTLRIGQTASQIDAIADVAIRARNSEPIGTDHGFSASVSVNEQVLDTVPSPTRIIAEGDVVSLNLGIRQGHVELYQGWTYLMQAAAAADRHLVETGRQALANGIAQVSAGAVVGQISDAIYETLTSGAVAACREFQGHGIGRTPYTTPDIPCFSTSHGRKHVLQNNDMLCINVIAFDGGWRTQKTPTGIETADGTNAVQFTHIVAVEDGGCTVLTSDRTIGV